PLQGTACGSRFVPSQSRRRGIVRMLGDTMRLPLLVAAATRVCLAATLSALSCLPAAAQQIDYSKLEIKTTDLGHGVYLLGWQGGDSLILVGDDGVLLVDTSVAQMGDKIKAAIAKVSSKPIELVINTHAHADHFGA